MSMNANTTITLPAGFEDLAPYTAWCLVTETERNRLRHACKMAELKAFNNALLPRVDAVVAHLNAFALNAMPEPEQRLMQMLLSLAEIAPAVESYHQPAVPDGFDPTRFVADERFVMRPTC